MSAGCVALCVDRLTCQSPQLIGLDGEALDAQRWLSVYVSGDEARTAVAERDGIDEVWVASCDDVDPINLAATLKADNPALPVLLVTTERCGSLCSRAHTASIDGVLDVRAFLERYSEVKARFAGLFADDGGAGREEPEAPFAGGGLALVEPGVEAREPEPVSAQALQPTTLERPSIVVAT